jgi:hypothetical protein
MLAEAPGAQQVLIAKSIGTLAAPLAAERQLPAIWLTPLLTADFVVAAIRANPAPALVVGGADDSLWHSAVARQAGAGVPGPADRGRVAARAVKR